MLKIKLNLDSENKSLTENEITNLFFDINKVHKYRFI